MQLAPTSSARVDRAAVESLGLAVTDTVTADCPPSLGCEWYPAPYEQYGPGVGDYGNHDLADRPQTGTIQYILLHDTEATYDTTLQLVSDPEYVSWHYTIRSNDGHIAQHVANREVAWHAGNWYVNMHSIGIEQEGFAADGAAWFTEALYQNSSTLVKHLAAEYGVPLDRAHVIGHDQVPGILPGNVAGMHWDPGPYWDWEHYFDLLGAPIAADRRGRSDVVTVAPGFADNLQPVTGCVAGQPSTTPCAPQGTNFVYLYSAPDAASPLVTDIGLRPSGAPSTTYVSDIGARAAAGQKFLVAETARVTGPRSGTSARRRGSTTRSPTRPCCRHVVRSSGRRPVPRCRCTAGPTRSSRRTPPGSRTRRWRRCSTRSSRARPTCWRTRGSRPTTTGRRRSTARCSRTASRCSGPTSTTRSGSATGSPTSAQPTW